MCSLERSGNPCVGGRRSPLNDASRSDTTLPQARPMRRRQRSGAARVDGGQSGRLERPARPAVLGAHQPEVVKKLSMQSSHGLWQLAVQGAR